MVVDEDGVDREDFAGKIADAGPKVKGAPSWRAVVSRSCFEVWLAGVEEPDGDLLPPSPGSHVGLLVARLLRET